VLSFSEKWQGPSTEIILKLHYCNRFPLCVLPYFTPIHNGKDLMTHPAICQDKLRLVDLYEQATRAYSDAVGRLNRIMGTSSRTDYQAHYRMTEALRLDALTAQKNLEEHIALHGC